MNYFDYLYNNTILLSKILLFAVALIYKIFAWVKKNEHYHTISDVYSACLIVVLCISFCFNQSKKTKCVEPKIVHDTIYIKK